jgi:cytoskeletal protein CcmA (bactofilin family)
MKHFLTSIRRAAAITTIAVIASVSTFKGEIPHTIAAGSWAPTLLVNTESFNELENGDGSTNIEMRFGRSTLKGKLFYDITNNRFKFDRDLFVGGTLTATGAAIIKGQISGASLRVEGNAGVYGQLSVTGSVKITNNAKIRGNLSGSSLNVDGYAQINGALSATGAIKTKSDLTINSDNDANDATVTFGNSTVSGTVKYVNSLQKFQFNKGISVQGNISGSSLRVDGSSVNINNVGYVFTGTQGSANTFLKNDGAGNLTWATASVGNGSGGIVEFHAEYPNSTYFASGSTTIGQLSTDYDTTNKENYYHWVSTRGTIQDYWIATRVKVPKNFNNFATSSGIVLRYRTTSTSNAVNYVNVRLLDTTGTAVAIGGGTTLTSTTASTWKNTALTNLTSGTYTPGGQITVLIKAATTSAGTADLANLTFNWSTTTP